MEIRIFHSWRAQVAWVLVSPTAVHSNVEQIQQNIIPTMGDATPHCIGLLSTRSMDSNLETQRSIVSTYEILACLHCGGL